MDFGFRFKEEIEIEENKIVDNWETVDPQIIQKRIEERKKVEESDNQLTNELFSSPKCKDTKSLNVKPPKNPKKKNLKIDITMINESHKKKIEIKHSHSKRPLAKEKDIFGGTSLDEIDQLACEIEESYLYSLD